MGRGDRFRVPPLLSEYSQNLLLNFHIAAPGENKSSQNHLRCYLSEKTSDFDMSSP